MIPSDLHSEKFDKLADSAELAPWLDEIIARTGVRHRPAACRMFAAVLHALRAELPQEDRVSFGSHLPPVARQIYDEDESPSEDAKEDFLSRVSTACPGLAPEQIERGVWSVFTMLSHHISPDVIRHVRERLPPVIRTAWNTAA